MSQVNIVGNRIRKLQDDINDLVFSFTEETGLFVEIESPAILQRLDGKLDTYSGKFRIEVKPA